MRPYCKRSLDRLWANICDGNRNFVDAGSRRSVPIDSVDSTVTPSIPATLLSSLISGSAELRQQLNYNAAAQTLTVTGISEASGSCRPDGETRQRRSISGQCRPWFVKHALWRLSGAL